MAGTDRWFHPAITGQNRGQSFGIFDLVGAGVVGRGDLHVYYNTETIQVGVERVPLGSSRLEFSAAVRAEGWLAQVMRYYFRDTLRVDGRGFFASYVLAQSSLKWLPGGRSSVELQVGARRWLFARDEAEHGTDPSLVLPPDTFAIENRLRYTYWDINIPGEEWEAQVLFPRLRGLAMGVELGVDVRTDSRSWGTLSNTADDGRNRPGGAIVMPRQWLRAGSQLTRSLRVQIEQSASYGFGEDDLTRVRVGGMSPYVVPVPGIPWPTLLCERLLAGQASLHWRPSQRYRNEFGVIVGGGAFNDPRRTGALSTFGGAGGTALFADLRIWRFQAYLRAGYGFPAGGIASPPHFSGFVGLGMRLF